jgi:hypothetical protein
MSIEVTGKPSGLELASIILRVGRPRLISPGFHHTPDTYNLKWFAAKGIQMLNTHPFYSYDFADDLRRGVLAASKGIFPMDELVTHRYPLRQLGEANQAAYDRIPGLIKAIVLPNAD